MNIKNLNIKLIDLRMYNDQQLSVINKQINVADGCLENLKRKGVIKLWFDNTLNVEVASLSKEDVGLTTRGYYKGIVIKEGIDPLSKKEKDNLLSMKATVFNTKSINTKSEESKPKTQNKTNTENTIDQIDDLIKQKQNLQERISTILKEMEIQLSICINEENFEKAAILRDKINKLK